MKILVTGAGGFVGRNLIPMLVKKHNITALVKNQQEAQVIKNQPVKIVVGDLSSNGPWQSSLTPQDVVIHLASEISSKDPGKFKKNNVIATQNLLKVSKRKKVKKIIHFSSAAVTSIRLDQYALTKKKQEELVVHSNIPFVAIRPSMIYGPSDDKNIGWLIKTIKKLPFIPLPGGGNFGRQPVYVGDICQIVLRLVEGSRKNEILEIHGYEYITLKEMIRLIKKEFKIKKLVIPIPIFALKLAFFINQVLLSNPKFTLDQIESLTSGEKFVGDDWKKEFAIIPTKFSEGLKRMNY